MTTDTGNFTSRRHYFTDRFADRQYRERFAHANIAQGVAAQIRAMREANGWTQATFGNVVGMKQSAVSQLENPDYGRASLTTLKRVASAFDVALVVRFEPFSELMKHSGSLSPTDFAVPSFDADRGFRGDGTAAEEITTAIEVYVQGEFPPEFYYSADRIDFLPDWLRIDATERDPVLVGQTEVAAR